MNKKSKNIPIIVDLDGTLIYSDVLLESSISCFKSNTIKFLKSIFILLIHGKAAFKRIISENSDININNLPYNTELIKWLMDQRENGRYIVLCTGSDYIYAKIADHLEVFDEVHASDGVRNLVGFSKQIFYQINLLKIISIT